MLTHVITCSGCTDTVHRCWRMWLHAAAVRTPCTDADACDYVQRLYGHRKRVCTGSWLWEKNLLLHRGFEPASVLRLIFQSDALPAELLKEWNRQLKCDFSTGHIIFTWNDHWPDYCLLHFSNKTDDQQFVWSFQPGLMLQRPQGTA